MRYIKLALISALLFVAGCFLLKSDNEKAIPNWKTQIDRSKSNAENSYDVIIVGGGFGGLSAGSLLAHNGYKVLVLEKNDHPGGLCSSYSTDGFRFCYGAEDIGGLFPRGPLTYLLKELNLKKSSYFLPNSRCFVIEKTCLDIPASEGNIVTILSDRFSNEKKAIHRFFEKAEKVLLQAYDEEMVTKWGIRLPHQLIPQVMPKKWIKEYPLTHKQLIEWKSKSYQDVLDEYFQDSALKKILSGTLLGYFGGRPIKVSASTVVTTSFEYLLYGGYHALQTPQHFAQALSDVIEKSGGKVLVSTAVDQIIVDTKGVKGVRVGSTEFKAQVVISNVNAKTTYRDLIDSRMLPPSFLAQINSLPMGSSAFALHLGVDASLTSYPDLISDKDNQVFISIPSHKDSALAPKGKSTVIVRETARFEDFIGKSSSELQEYLQQRAQALLEKGASLIPELAKPPVVQRIITPLDFEQLIHIPLGSIYGFDESEVQLRPYFKSPIPGLYLSSATIDGPGVTSVIRNGIVCAHDIMEWKTK